MPDPYREPVDDESAAENKIENPGAPEKIVAQEKVPEKAAEIIKPEMPSSAIPPVAAVAPAPAAQMPQAPAGDPQILEKDRQLKMLVDLAFDKGLDKAVEAARATNNAYLIDEFHDMLVDKLRQELIDKGKLTAV